MYYILEMKDKKDYCFLYPEYSYDSNCTTAWIYVWFLWMFSVYNTDNDSCDSDGNEPNISEEDQGKSESDDEDR